MRTPSHLALLNAEQRFFAEEETENARLEVSQSLQTNVERMHQLQAEQAELEGARSSAQRLHDLVHELYILDEQVEGASQVSGRKLAELQEQIVKLQKEIQDLESPRDDSFDNSTVIWASEVFTKTTVGEVSRYGDEAVILLACGKLEELGFTVRRCGTYDEAVERAWQLRATGHLRCVIAGGEAAKGCGRNCTRSHDQDGNCIVCGGSWAEHSGHTCSGGRQGSWLVKGRAGTVGPKGIDAAKLTTSLIEDVPSGSEPIPPSRIIIFAGGSSNLREEKRLALWKSGITVTEDKATLLEWAESHPPWIATELEEEEKAGKPPPMLKREMSSGIRTLRSLRQRLIDVSFFQFKALAFPSLPIAFLRSYCFGNLNKFLGLSNWVSFAAREIERKGAARRGRELRLSQADNRRQAPRARGLHPAPARSPCWGNGVGEESARVTRGGRGA
jgi:hypothetical protein